MTAPSRLKEKHILKCVSVHCLNVSKHHGVLNDESLFREEAAIANTWHFNTIFHSIFPFYISPKPKAAFLSVSPRKKKKKNSLLNFFFFCGVRKLFKYLFTDEQPWKLHLWCWFTSSPFKAGKQNSWEGRPRGEEEAKVLEPLWAFSPINQELSAPKPADWRYSVDRHHFLSNNHSSFRWAVINPKRVSKLCWWDTVRSKKKKWGRSCGWQPTKQKRWSLCCSEESSLR